MATIDEVFETMSAYDTSFEYLTINPDTRVIEIPKNELLFGVAGDNNSERKYFMCPRYVGDNLDVSKCYVQINFNNGHDDPDGYLVTDLALADGVVTFSWLIDDKVVAYKGEVEFSVNISDGERDWNTTTATGTSLISLAADVSNVTSKTTNVVAQLREMVDAQTTAVEAEGATQITNVQNAASEATTEAQTQIEAKGAATLETIPDDYTETYNNANKALRTRANAIVGTAEGKTIVAEDSSDDYLRGIRIFGKSTQVSTSGAQLINVTLAGSMTVSGLTLAPTEDGDILVNGTHTDGAMWLEFGRTSLSASNTYTLSCTEGFSIHLWDLTNNKEFKTKKLDDPYLTIEVTESIDCAVVLNDAVSNKTYSNIKVSAILTEGSTALPWEPYTGGMASPNPEYPQDIVSVENPAVTVYGKNLAHPVGSVRSVNGYTITPNEDGTVTISGSATAAVDTVLDLALIIATSTYETTLCKANVEYTLTCWKDGVVTETPGTKQLLADGSVKWGWTEVEPQDREVTKLYRQFIPEVGDTDVCGTYAIQIETGNVATDYEPYSRQSIDISYTLPGIPVTSGGNYTDENGQQWICDEIDYERGVYIQRCYGEVVVLSYQENLNRYSGTLSYTADASIADDNGIPVLSTSLIYNKDAGSGSPITNGIRIAATSPKYIVAYHNGDVLDSIYILYPLATPIETPLTEADIYNFSQLHSNYPTTTVFNDAEARMEVSYNKDTTTVIQKLIDAITALGGTV